ncbi:Ubiquitin carboxyl-terminal hydrolase [Carpediemonas membranifera]|uniref:Ubiquitin carboxyl-terminal hydrolase n=1 Tax=Carpediemonas membranifera TaxID=201153 RepID=A0A8J6B6Q4_9EUKA|nr:Ubiquitin carboxyl-terminal hydrolase [Carpediemonas membranifera]|eukprot:KAG9396813.1 Ubiquitin carboxyl-terminal hydrolase [Carpediemonas membranifera]
MSAQSLKVVVRWGKRVFNVGLDTSADLLQFKTQLFSVTNVPPDRQFLLGTGSCAGLLADDVDLSSLAIHANQEFLLIGSDHVVNLSTESADTEMSAEVQVGLENLGNTCYLNSCVQMLKSVPELVEFLKNYSSADEYDPDHKLVAQISKVISSLVAGRKSVYPAQLVSQLRENHPQFAEKGEHGAFMQQDAEEAFTQLVTSLNKRLTTTNVSQEASKEDEVADVPMEGPDAPLATDKLMERLFGIGTRQTMRLAGTDDTPVASESAETLWKLTCHIGNSTSQLLQGLQESAVETIERKDPETNEDRVYERKTELVRLPEYVTVQFMRFFWDQQNQKKQKILRSVRYPATFDAAPLCTPELQETIKDYRRAATKARDIMDGLAEGTAEPPEMPRQDGIIVNNLSGMYELHAVITHKGRRADGGHYLGWARDAQGQWQRYDDDKVTPITEKDALELHGGGDWHTAYMALYKAKTTV